MKAWIVEFDNGYDYEDHDTTIIVVCLSEETAKKEVVRLTKWLTGKRDAVPTQPDDELSNDEWMKVHTKRQKWINALNPPFGEKCLSAAVWNNSGYFRVYERKAKP